MNKEFIPYEEALELKKLGFDIPSISGYSYPDSDKLLAQAILYQQAFRWFREKHQISPSIHCMSEQGNSWRYHIPNEGGETNFSTYEEAELACLIKLIEIVKNKQP